MRDTLDHPFALPSLDRVSKLRDALGLAGRENSRMVAATIGRYLEVILSGEAPRPEVAEATEAVRDASLGYLASFHGRGDVGRARHAALQSVDRLEESLVS